MFEFHAHFILIIVFLLFSLPAGWIDIRERRIPDWTVFSGMLALSVLRLFLWSVPITRILMEAAIGSGIFLGIRRVTRGKLGMGDVKFAAFMAVFLGFPGWFVATSLASLSGLIFALTGIVIGKLDTGTKLPFAPFLVAGSLGAHFIIHSTRLLEEGLW